VINNPLAFLGSNVRSYKGAELLPERTVPENSYTEELIEYRTIIANDGTRYSPAQKKGGVLIGSVKVDLGYQDAASEFTSQAYDALIRLLEQETGRQGVEGGEVSRSTIQAMASMTNWSDVTLMRPLLEVIEKQRWQAIIDGSVVRSGDNGYTEIVSYPNPTSHRVSAGGNWSNDSYDPYLDIMAQFELLAAKGFVINRILTTQAVISILAKNAIMRARCGHITVKASDNTVNNTPAGRASLDRINEQLRSDGLPALERYDLQYRTNTGTTKFMSSTVSGEVFVMVCTTGRDQTIDRGDLEPLIIPNTLGYAAIGRAAGQSGPGRAQYVRFVDGKPPRVEGQSWQASLPVIQSPEAIAVIRGIQ